MVIYGYFNRNSGDVIYVGLDTNGTRHTNHMKPSKKHIQPINKYLQENPTLWEYKEIWKPEFPIYFSDNIKKIALHGVEVKLIKEWKPEYNIYGK